MTDSSPSVEYMLTTIDNPFNPFTEWDAWLAFDIRHGHGTLALLGRIAKLSDELSDPDQEFVVQDAIDEIARYNVSGIHRKVSRFDFPST